MQPPTPARADWVPIYLVSLVLVAFLLVVGAIARLPADPPRPGSGATTSPRPQPSTVPSRPDPTVLPVVPKILPGGRAHVFAGNRVLVAYYGTAGTGSLGVLGEAGPDRIMARLRRAAAPFARSGRPVQPVFELIVTLAHAGPTRTGTYSSDIPRAAVRRYIEAAHRHGVLVVLDLQPGRSDFLTVARRWAWALKDPWVGLALDPEWRMGPRQVPGRVIGAVRAAEVNRVSRWLEQLTRTAGLPEKIFLLHQFRTSMVTRIERVRPRPHLVLVQHVDGFGPPRLKLATFRAVARPHQFVLGFKLFYDEDVPRMRPDQVLRIRPKVRFVSFQ